MAGPVKTRPELAGPALALLAFALFSGHDALVKALGGAYSPFQIVFFSVLFGFPLVTLLLIGDPEKGTLRPRYPWLVALRTLLGIVTSACAFTAFTTLPLAQVYAIIFAQPLLITALSVPFLGETVGARRWAAVVAGLIGVLVVLRPGSEPLQPGHAAALGAAFGGAGVAVIVRRIGKEERSAVMILYPMLGIFAVMSAVLPFVYRPMTAGALATNAALAALGFLAILAMIQAYRTAVAAVVAPMQYTQIVWATAFGVLFFGELPDLWTFVGAAIIITSGVVIVVREVTGPRSVKRPVTSGRTFRGDTVTAPRAESMFGVPGRTPRPLHRPVQ